jgi:hypothetical protein
MNDRTIAKTLVLLGEDAFTGYMVSSVYLPFPHDGREYETMVFNANKDGNITDWTDLYCKRYYNEEEAMAGHETICAALHSASLDTSTTESTNIFDAIKMLSIAATSTPRQES